MAGILNLPDTRNILFQGDECNRLLFGGSIVWSKPVTAQLRNTTLILSTTIHSGHSLIDTYINEGGWPGFLINIVETVHPDYVWGMDAKSTIPGSPMWYRWMNRAPDEFDPRANVESFDSMIITEVSPPPYLGDTDKGALAQSVTSLMNFSVHMVNHGRAPHTIAIWTNWPNLTGIESGGGWPAVSFRDSLIEFEKSNKYIADYVTWKTKEHFRGTDKQLPEDWKVWIFPGHRWMARVYDDILLSLVPDITNIQELFRDTIHPNDIGSYGITLFVTTMMDMINLGTRTGIYKPEYISQDLYDYFVRIAFEITQQYGPIGFGGIQGNEIYFDPETDEDLVPVLPVHGRYKESTPLTAKIMLSGHSSLIMDYSLFDDWTGGVRTDFGQSSKEIWDGNGAMRTDAEYDVLIQAEGDDYENDGMALPNSEKGRENLQHLYWAGLEAKDRNAKFFLFSSPSSRYRDLDEPNRLRFNYYRWWLEDKLEIPVYIIPSELYITELRKSLTDNDIFSDAVHMRPGGPTEGVGYLIYAFLHNDLPEGRWTNGLYAEAAWRAYQSAYHAGLAGSEYGDMLELADPLPNPLPRPGEVVNTVPEFTNEGIQQVFTPENILREGSPQVGDILRVSGWSVEGTPTPRVRARFQKRLGNGIWTSISGLETIYEVVLTEDELDHTVRGQLQADNSEGASDFVNVQPPIGLGPVVEVPVDPVEPEIPAGDLEWYADSYTGPTLSGTQPTVDGDYLVFNNRLSSTGLTVTNGFYICMEVDLIGGVSGDASYITILKNPNNIFENPYFSMESHGSTISEFSLYGAGSDLVIPIYDLGNGPILVDIAVFNNNVSYWDGTQYVETIHNGSWPETTTGLIIGDGINFRTRGIYISNEPRTHTERDLIREAISS